MDRLKTQLAILPHVLGDNKKSIFEALLEELIASDNLKRMLSEVDKLIRLYLTIPVTNATAEHSFSALKRVTTYLRSTMTQERLNNCLIMHVFIDKVDQLNLTEISSEFICRSE